MYEDAEAALSYAHERIGADARDTWIYGHSLGAAVAIDLALKHPELLHRSEPLRRVATAQP